MGLPLHQLAASCRLQAISVLTWLMLIFNASAAMPMRMMAMPHADAPHAMLSKSGEQQEHRHLEADTAAPSCCLDPSGRGDADTHHHCACAAGCSAAVPSVAFGGVVSGAIGARYAIPDRIKILMRTIAPPLRPSTV